MPWIEDELQTLHVGDRRLQRRGRRLRERFCADPQASSNAACAGWAETQAAYRFFDNPTVQPQALREPHPQATRQRLAQHPVVLLVQDTTELDYSAHPAAGAGPLRAAWQVGFLDHRHLAFTPEGLCLGVLDVQLWARDTDGFGRAKQRQYDPLQTKETYRWLQGYRLACRTAQEVPGTHLVSVADGEGDLDEVFVEAHQARPEARADYGIRLGKDRALPEPGPEAGPDAYRKVRPAMASAPVLGTRPVDWPRTPQRAARTAALAIRAAAVPLKAPTARAVPCRTGRSRSCGCGKSMPRRASSRSRGC